MLEGPLPRLGFWPTQVGGAHCTHTVPTLPCLRVLLLSWEPQAGGDGSGWCQGLTAQLCSPRVRGAQRSRAASVLIVRGIGGCDGKAGPRLRPGLTYRKEQTLRSVCTQGPAGDVHTRKKKVKMGQKRGKDGEGEMTGGKREGIQPLQAQLQWKALDIGSKAVRSSWAQCFQQQKQPFTWLCSLSALPRLPTPSPERHRSIPVLPRREQRRTWYHRHGSVGQEPPRETKTTWQESHAPSPSRLRWPPDDGCCSAQA